MDYLSAIDQLLTLTDFERKSRAGEPPDFHLRRMELLLAGLGNPHLATPVVFTWPVRKAREAPAP